MELRDVPRGRPITEDQAKTILNAVLDSGINYIDTSNDYGRSEEFIGKYNATIRYLDDAEAMVQDMLRRGVIPSGSRPE